MSVPADPPNDTSSRKLEQRTIGRGAYEVSVCSGVSHRTVVSEPRATVGPNLTLSGRLNACWSLTLPYMNASPESLRAKFIILSTSGSPTLEKLMSLTCKSWFAVCALREHTRSISRSVGKFVK